MGGTIKKITNSSDCPLILARLILCFEILTLLFAKMNSYKYCLLLILFLFSLSVFPTDNHAKINIEGHVKNKLTGENIPYISVGLKNTTIGVSTNISGHYALSNIPKGKFTMIVSGLGYKPEEKEVNWNGDDMVEVNFEIEEDALHIAEVVVTAGRHAQKRTETPVIVNTINAKMLDVTQSTVLGEGLNFCTGLRYENDCQNCGFSQIRMNGMEGPYSQVLINSRPIFSGLAGVYGLELIPANMLEKIEVVRGGGSVLYGSNAIAGTINLILKDPKSNSFEAGFDVNAIGMGVKNSNGPVPDCITSFNGSLVTEDYKSGIAVYGHVRDRGMFDANNDEFSEIAPMDNTVVGARVFQRIGYRSKLVLDYFHITEKRDGGNKQDYPLHERDVAEAVSHKMNTGALTFEQYLRENDLLSVFVSGSTLFRDSYYGANYSLKDYGKTMDKSYNTGIQYKADFNKSSLIGGFENTGSFLTDKKLGYPDYDNATIIDGKITDVPHTPNTLVSDQSLITTGLFAQYEIKLGLFRILAGGRLDHYSVDDKLHNSDKSGTVFVPRASVMYDITSWLQARLSYSTGYRAPQIFDEDLHIETSGARQVINVNDPDLKQENSSSYMFSLDFNKQLGHINTNFLAEGFYTRLHNPFRNEIGEPDANGVVIYTRVNANAAVVAGVNMELKLSPSDNLSFAGGFTVQSSRYKDPDENFNERKFFRTPNNYGFFTCDWKFAGHFGAAFTGNYTGHMLVPYFGIQNPDGELRKSQPFFDAGLKLYYDMPVGEHVNVQWFTGMKNIFNSYQDDFDSGINRDPSYIYGPSLPRTFFVGFKIMGI